MALNSRNYQKIKLILQSISPDCNLLQSGNESPEADPFSLWKQWGGNFSLENNHPVCNGVELILVNKSAKHCICGHSVGKKEKKPLGEIGTCSIPDPSENRVADDVATQEIPSKSSKVKLLLNKSLLDSSLIPYFLGNYFLLAGQSCSRHFLGNSEEAKEGKITYIHQGDEIVSVYDKVQTVFDQLGSKEKDNTECKTLHSGLSTSNPEVLSPESIIYRRCAEKGCNKVLKDPKHLEIRCYGCFYKQKEREKSEKNKKKQFICRFLKLDKFENPTFIVDHKLADGYVLAYKYNQVLSGRYDTSPPIYVNKIKWYATLRFNKSRLLADLTLGKVYTIDYELCENTSKGKVYVNMVAISIV
jgi:hypothetical protein